MNQPTLEQAKGLSRKTGLFFICASCPRMWEGIALGKESCTGKDCGSPVRRKDFPEYDGFVKDMSAICLVCGSEDIYAYAKVEGRDRQMGLCKDHLEVIDDNAAPTNGIIVEQKKVFIVPNPVKAMNQYQDAKHTI